MKHSLFVAALAIAVALLSSCQLGGPSDAPESEVATTAPPSRAARASYENGSVACRRTQATDMLPPFSQTTLYAAHRQLATRLYLDYIRRIVRANLNARNDFGIALQGCLEATWPKNVPVPSRGLRTLVGGETLSFPPRVILPHETLTCVSDGIRVKAIVPPAGRTILGHADGLHDSAEIRVTTRADGTVLARCR